MSAQQNKDLAGSVLNPYGAYTPEQLFAGEGPILSNQAIVAVGAAVKYGLMAWLPTDGTVVPFVVGTHTAQEAVIAAQDAVVGANLPFFHGGYFNDAVIVWGAQTGAFSTLAKRKAFFAGTDIHIGAIAAGA